MFGHDRPHDIGRLIGYLPEERGLYPSMKADRGDCLPWAHCAFALKEGLLARGRIARTGTGARPCCGAARSGSFPNGMAQTVQLPRPTLVPPPHRPRLVVLDEPFSGLDAINQGKLELMIRALAGTTG